MILYYTASQKTKIFAEALGDVLGLSVYALKSKLNDKSSFKFIIHALYLAVTGKGYPVSNMPEAIDSREIFVCTPIWGGQVAGPAWFFLNNAELKGIKVNLLLTCDSIVNSDKYRKKALDALSLIDCVPGEVYVFATGKEMPEHAVITEQLHDMLPEPGSSAGK